MSITRKFAFFNEECVVSFSQEKDALLYMPLCGITRCLPNYYIHRENSPECVFEYIVAGKGTLHVNGLTFYPQAGDVYIAPIGSTHEYRTDPRDCWEKIWFNIQGTLVIELLKQYRLEQVYFLPQSGLEGIFRDALENMRHAPDNSHETATLAVHQLIYHMSRAVHTEENAKSPMAQKMKQYIDGRLYSTLHIDDLAARVGLSPSQTTRIFQNQWGCTPYQYFLTGKFDLACSLLRNTTKTVKEIAGELNFADAYYFSNLFKRRFACTPGEYRRNPNRTDSVTGENIHRKFSE